MDIRFDLKIETEDEALFNDIREGLTSFIGVDMSHGATARWITLCFLRQSRVAGWTWDDYISHLPGERAEALPKAEPVAAEATPEAKPLVIGETTTKAEPDLVARLRKATISEPVAKKRIVYDIPPNVIRWEDMHDDVPTSNAAVHAWYEERGLKRYVAVIEHADPPVKLAIYWNPDSAKQDVAVYPNKDSNGFSVSVQESPDLGVAHLIPIGWGEEEAKASFGNAGTWSAS